MNAVAENKRRVLALAATLIVLLAIGFAIGRVSSGPAKAKAAGSSARSSTARVSSAHDAGITSLRAQLLQAQRGRADATRELAGTWPANRRLSATSRDAQGRLADVRRCQSIRRPRLFRRCVRSAVG